MTARVVAFEVELGTPGRSIAQAVAAALGYSYHDEDILVDAASAAGVSNDVMAAVEHVPSFFVRFGEVLEVARLHELPTDLAGGRLADGGGWMLAPRNRSYLEWSVRQVADAGECVLVGHAAHAVLKDICPGLFTVLIHGSTETRAAYYAKTQDMSIARATAIVQEADRRQSDYLKRVYHVEAANTKRYDLSISTDELPDATATELIVASARHGSEVGDLLHPTPSRAAR